jgi:hypothetical protein
MVPRTSLPALPLPHLACQLSMQCTGLADIHCTAPPPPGLALNAQLVLTLKCAPPVLPARPSVAHHGAH